MDKAIYALRVLRQRGLIFFWHYFTESIWFDLRRGTSTFARVPKDRQDIGGAEADNGLLYVASFTSVVRRTLALARGIAGPEAQVFDLGCGKGKAVILAAEAGAAPVIGIEYDPTLAEIARRNLTRRGLGPDRAQIITGSALDLLDHARSGPLVIYLYNSFQGETLRAMFDTLAPVPHVLIYVDPAEAELLTEYGYHTHARHTGRYNADTWVVASRGLTIAEGAHG